jgi:hypothetical protein
MSVVKRLGRRETDVRMTPHQALSMIGSRLDDRPFAGEAMAVVAWWAAQIAVSGIVCADYFAASEELFERSKLCLRLLRE